MKTVDQDLIQKISSLSGPDRLVLLEFIEATPKTPDEMEIVFKSLAASISYRKSKANRRFAQ